MVKVAWAVASTRWPQSTGSPPEAVPSQLSGESYVRKAAALAQTLSLLDSLGTFQGGLLTLPVYYDPAKGV